jgi:hypothetical protein
VADRCITTISVPLAVSEPDDCERPVPRARTVAFLEALLFLQDLGAPYHESKFLREKWRAVLILRATIATAVRFHAAANPRMLGFVGDNSFRDLFGYRIGHRLLS